MLNWHNPYFVPVSLKNNPYFVYVLLKNNPYFVMINLIIFRLFALCFIEII